MSDFAGTLEQDLKDLPSRTFAPCLCSSPVRTSSSNAPKRAIVGGDPFAPPEAMGR